MTAPEERPDQLAELTAEVAHLRDLFQRRLLEDRAKQRLYDELYGQLEFARSDLATQFVAPLVRELLLVVDRIDGQLKATTNLATAEQLCSVLAELLEVLNRRGVRLVEAVGVAFDPRVHEAVDSAEVGSAEEHGRVVGQRRPGFLLGAKLVRPAQVVVGRHRSDL